MKLVFLYYSEGSNQEAVFNPGQRTQNKFLLNFHTEGLDAVFKSLLDRSVIERCTVVVESVRTPGKISFSPRYEGLAVPNLKYIDSILDDETIVFTRGGFRSWHDYLIKWNAEGRWSWLYAANTGRQRWPFWDIVFNDLEGKTYMDANDRLQLQYAKPLNTDIFTYAYRKPQWVFMIGASHVHDKKGQFRAVNALAYVKQKYGVNIKSILPGGFHRGVYTNTIQGTIKHNMLDISLPGMLSRNDLAEAIRSSKIFIHAGASGQNDRGPLEAMACGCKLVIASPGYHDPMVYNDSKITFVPAVTDDPCLFGEDLYSLYKKYEVDDYDRQYIANKFLSTNATEKVVDKFSDIIYFMKCNRMANKDALRKHFLRG